MVVAIITARANSKGLPGKNMIDVGGMPLLAYSLATASATTAFDRVILSTDMDAAIDLASDFPRVEVPFKRPAELCSDTATHAEVVDHLLQYLEKESGLPEYIVLLQPTSPFRRVEEMERGVSLLKNGAKSVLGVCPVMHHPAEYLYKDAQNKTNYLMPEFKELRRQEYPDIYFNNGAFYGVSVPFYQKTKQFFDDNSELLVMGEQSLIDIDTPFDLILARAVAEHYKK
ncbi:MAG: acylneuraminate cytidylyltransferase family protein [Bacteroidetes bacterium]|nr:acylneuraminate cytidylyltransferase family protein [Bacteroidota bacterium]